MAVTEFQIVLMFLAVLAKSMTNLLNEELLIGVMVNSLR